MLAVVTGGSGFIGSTLALQLMREGYDVRVVDRVPIGAKGLYVDGAEFLRGDVGDSAFVERALEGADEVYHLSGILGTSELQGQVPAAIDVNIRSTALLFETAVKLGVPRVFYPTKPTVWLNAYTITKYAAEQFAEMFGGIGTTRIRALRYFNVYGPGQAMLPVRKIVPMFALQARSGVPIEIFGDGEQTVDMVYSRDVADMTIRHLRSDHGCSTPDCGSGVSTTVVEVAEAVNAYFDNTAGIEHLPMRDGEDPGTQLVAELDALHESIGVVSQTPYETALAETLASYAALDGDTIARALRYFARADGVGAV